MRTFRLGISALRLALAVCVMMAMCSCIAPPRLAEVDSEYAALAGQQLRAIELRAAGNEWVSFNLQLVGQSSGNVKIRLSSLQKLGCDIRCYRRTKIANGYGPSGEALIPLIADRDSIRLPKSDRAVTIWVDVRVPRPLAGGQYQATCELLQGPWVVDRLPITLKVHDFSLPERPSLSIVGEMDSAALQKLYSGQLPDSLGPLFECCQENRVELWFSDLPGSAPSTAEASSNAMRSSMGEEMAIRAAGLNASLRGGRAVHWRDPAGMSRADLAWFYPGQIFGEKQPVQSVWLKLMRQSEQDAEYLKLAEQRGQGDTARKIARLLVQPRETPFSQVDIAADDNAPERFRQGKQLLAELIDAYDRIHPASVEQKRQLSLDLAEWIAEHGRPVVLPRWTRWTWDPGIAGQMNLTFGVDIYNPSDNQALRSSLRWSGTPLGWRNVGPPSVIAQMPAHRITHADLKNSFDAITFHITTNGPMQAMAISGFDGSSSTVDVQLPVASSDRRRGAPVIDGSLSDWSTDDTVFNGNLIYSSSGGNATVRKAISSAGVYTNFSSDALFVAFKLDQVASADEQCRMVIQPMYGDGSQGEMMHLTCAANGECRGADGVRYAATLVDGIWRGELAIPWTMIGKKGVPSALRFNFFQHDSNGWASWAGPVAPGNDDAITGVLVLRNAPGDLVK